MVLTDGTRSVKAHHVADSHHSDSFLIVYLPREKLLIEADSFTPGPPPMHRRRRNSTHITRTWWTTCSTALPVDRILPLHGRIVSVNELYDAVRPPSPR